MITVHLLIEDDYLETFMTDLPKDKVVVVEEDFEQNKQKLQDVLGNYSVNEKALVPFYESMKTLNQWLKEREV
jgi:hypothetical protein